MSWIASAWYEVGGTVIMGVLFVAIGGLMVLVEKRREERADTRRWSRDGRLVR